MVRRRSAIAISPLVLLASLCILLLLPAPAVMVKRHDFKRCDQSAFCVRQRAFAKLKDLKHDAVLTSYSLQDINVDAAKGRIMGVVLKKEGDISTALDLELAYLDPAKVATGDVTGVGDSVRFRLTERNPASPRFELVEDLALVNANVPSRRFNTSSADKAHGSNEHRVHLSDDLLVVLRRTPFRFEVSSRGQPLLTFNERGYLSYEQERAKDADAVPDAPDDAPAPAEPAADGSVAAPPELSEEEKELKDIRRDLKKDRWEESFGGKQDSKPHGPTSIGFDFGFPNFNYAYGLPEHASSYALKPTRGLAATYAEPYRLYNFDVFEYELNNPMALYGAVPFIMAHRRDASVGVLWLNAAEMWVKMDSYEPFATSKKTSATTMRSHWMAESGILDVIIMVGKKPATVVKALTALTGRTAIPQYFAVAYHQCRWNYLDEQDVAEVDANFDKHDIPYDVLWLDIEHTDGKKYFTWDKVKFPKPLEMQASLAAKGRKMVTIIDPHLKREDGYHVSKEAKDLNLFVKGKGGEDYEAWCWPGSSNWIDYLNPAGRLFWAEQFKYNKYEGSSPTLYTWNDMNEPSVFSGPEITMPKDNVHFNGWEHRDVHNVYGSLQHRATYEGHLLRSDNKDRPFVLSRAFFIGTQRYGAIWTGDNTATWDHLEASVPMLLTIGMSGIAFAGADVGGFFGNPDKELLVRWYQAGAFQPFFRAHAHIDTKRREPWLFGEPHTTQIREAIRRRYRLMPYVYTLFWEASHNGMPVMRPLMLEFPDDENVFDQDESFMLGSALLVQPVVNSGKASVEMYLPTNSRWYDYETHALVNSGDITVPVTMDKIPVFLRGGQIIPRRDRVRRAAALSLHDPFTLIVALDAQGTASGTLYLDDGHSYDHESGSYLLTRLTYSGGRLVAKPERIAGAKTSRAATEDEIVNLGARVERVVVIGLAEAPQKIAVDGGKRLTFTSEKVAGGVVAVTVKDPGSWIGTTWSVSFA